MRNRRVLLLGGNYFPEQTGIGKYNGEMIDWLAQHEFDCTVVTTYPYYPEWSVHKNYRSKQFWFSTERRQVAGSNSIRIIRCPHYVPANPSGMKRLISDFSFFLSAYLVTLWLVLTRKFDKVVAVVPSFSIGLLAILYKQIRSGLFVYHVQDLQIDAARDLKLIRSAAVLKALFRIERFILSRADVITTISPGMQQRVQAKCSKPVQLFPNWVDIDKFCPVADPLAARAKYGFTANDRLILYSGAIGVKQGLELIIHAARVFNNRPEFKFLICGSGPYKQNLEKFKETSGADNVYFMPLLPVEEFNLFLNIADIHLVLQKRNASDLVMPSKLTTILAVGGVALVSAEEGTSLYKLMQETDMGLLVAPESEEQLVEAIENTTTDLLAQKKIKARNYALEHMSINKVLEDFCKQILEEPVRAATSNVQVVGVPYTPVL